MTVANVWPKPPPELLPPLLRYLRRRDVDPVTQADLARYVVSGAWENPEAVEAVMEFWSRPLDNRTRVAALNALANSRSKDPRIIKLIVSSLDDRDFDVRSAAFQGLTRMGPAALHQAGPAMEKVVDEYVALLKEKNGDVNRQISAMEVLLMYEHDDPRVVSAVVEFYSRPLDLGSRIAAQNALRIPNLMNVRLIDLIIGSLRDPNPQVRSNAAYVLKDMGMQALKRAQPGLERLAHDPEQPAEVSEAARLALREISGPTR
jgi:HEAT repeat protein